MTQTASQQEFQQLLSAFTQLTQSFIDDVDVRPVARLNALLPAQDLKQNSRSIEQCIALLKQQIIPQLSASRGPRYWGFVTGGATPIATFADWLVSTFDQNVAKGGDSIATEVERQTLQWLVQLFDLPATFQGIITTGATSANFLGALCGRQFAGNQQAIDVAKQGVFGLKVEVFSTTPHASMLKALGMAGMGQQTTQYIRALPDSEAMDVADLAIKLQNSKSPGKIIIASAGTVTATDFDDLLTIAKLARKHNAWLHVDAAFGIFERLVAPQDSLTKGLELGDSITLDSHKWLNVPYESGVFLTRHLDLLFNSCDIPAPYLINNGELPDFMSLGVENSRRFRALPVWMTLLAYGKAGITEAISSNLRLAKLFAQKIQESTSYELMLPCRLNVVLFRPNCEGLSGVQADKKTDQFLHQINQSGKVLLSPGKWQGVSVIRAALSNWETQQNDIEIVMSCLEQIAVENSE